MVRPLRALMLLLVLVSAASSVISPARAGEFTFATDHLAIETVDGRSLPFSVELALTPEQRAQGLMFREELAPDAGMLFLFDRESPRAFWMKNTYLPLDILFLDSSGTIVSIARDTTPLSETPIPSQAPAAAVLELNAGTAARLDIAPGDTVAYRAFAQ